MVQPIPLRPTDASPKPETPAAQPSLRLVKAAPRLTAEEREFLPATIELIETPLSPTLRFTAWALCGLVTAAIIWASLSHIDMVAVADGKVVPLGQVKVVQPLETAMIRAIHVDEGDHVRCRRSCWSISIPPRRAPISMRCSTIAPRPRSMPRWRGCCSRAIRTEPFHGPDGADSELVEQSHNQAQREIEKHLATDRAASRPTSRRRKRRCNPTTRRSSAPS